MADNIYAQKPGEDNYEYGLRLITTKIEQNPEDLDWQDIVDYVGLDCHRDSLRKACSVTPYSSYKVMQYYRQKVMEGEVTTESERCELDSKITEFQKERQKLATEKLEYHKMLRESARDDLIFEKLADAIKALPEHEIPCARYKPTGNIYGAREGILVFGDEHYGAEFEIKGLYGEVINSYNIDIAESRMDDLLRQAIDIIKLEGLEVVHVFNMGDFTDGVLRVGQLRKLQLGVVDSTVRYMEYLSSWLNELSKYAYVKFQMVHGNHSELRMLGQTKGTFKDENMGKVVAAYIKMRLKDNPNFEFCENPTGLIFADVLGFNMLGIHGEVKNMEQAIKDFSSLYGEEIDYLFAGHLHHRQSCSAGYRREVIRVPSVVGTDEYAMSLNRMSDAGAVFVIIEQGVGKTTDYSIYLN